MPNKYDNLATDLGVHSGLVAVGMLWLIVAIIVMCYATVLLFMEFVWEGRGQQSFLSYFWVPVVWYLTGISWYAGAACLLGRFVRTSAFFLLVGVIAIFIR